MIVHTISLLGKRESNEDQYEDIINIDNQDKNIKPINYFAIYDGHGGKEISKYIKNTLSHYFLRKDVPADPMMKEYPKYIIKVFNHIQSKLKIEKRDLAAHTGSTALSIIMFQNSNKTKKYMYVANLGDCRAILCNKSNIAIPLTKDHKPNTYEEKNRILALGGQIKLDGNDWRIKDLSVSRAFGDLDATPFVTNVPELFRYEISKNDKFIIMGCDGIWDVMSNQDAVDFVLESLDYTSNKKNQQNTNNKSNIAKLLGEQAIKKGSQDNITVIILFF